MKESQKVWGVDVSKNYIVAYDGETFYKFGIGEIEDFGALLKPGDVVVLEQTGVYSLPWIFSFLKRGAEVYIAHTTALKQLRAFIGASKNDVKDAELLRKLYFEGRFIYRFDENRFWLRFYFFSYRRSVKDFSILVNRLRAFIHLVKPNLGDFKTSRKGLEELKKKIEGKVKKDFAYAYIYRLVEKLLLTIEDRKIFEKELHKYLVIHKDYEILKSFPHFSDLVIAGLVSTYWDIERFQSSKVKTFSNGKVKIKKVEAVDRFISYLIGSSLRWQSGKMDKSKKVQKRPYLLGLLYPIYIQSGAKKSVLYPLWNYIRVNYSKLSGNQRYIKFLDRILRLVYLAVKHRWTFKEVIEYKAQNTLDEELKNMYLQILERVRGE